MLDPYLAEAHGCVQKLAGYMTQKKRHDDDGRKAEPLAAPQMLGVAELRELVLLY
jgi:hypothetical protein